MSRGVYKRRPKYPDGCCVCGSHDNVSISKIGPLCHKHKEQFRKLGRVLEYSYKDPNKITSNKDGTASVELRNRRGTIVGYAIIDECDIEKVSKFKFGLDRTGYAMSSDISMHRLIMDAKQGEIVDHVNGNILDNRKCNLRLCNRSENTRNRHLVTNRYGVTGVSYVDSIKKWRVKIKKIHIGYFSNFEDAKQARYEAEKRLFGDFAPNHQFDIITNLQNN